MADVFISYSKQEPELTIALAGDLERLGYTTWWDTSLLPGEEFQERITSELDKARAVIVIWTASSVNSRWVQAEAQLASAQNKLITVRSQDLHPDRIPLPFNTRQTDLVTDRQKILGALLRHNLLPPLDQRESVSGNPGGASAKANRYVDVWQGNSLISQPKSFWRRTRPSALRRFPRLDRMKIAFAIIILLFAAATIEILGLSRALNHTLVSLVQIHQDGVPLEGRYLFPNYLLIFLIVLLAVLGAALCILLAANLGRKPADSGEDIKSLRQDIDDIIRYAGNITSYIYPGDNDVPRFDILSVQVRHLIQDNGDTTVTAVFEIRSANEPAHFWKYWINADPESIGVRSLRRLNFEVVDVDTMRKLDWLPTLSDTHHKVFAIFFPEVEPGRRKKLRISFFWPGYMKKLTDLGATNFDWTYRSQHPEKRASFRKEWIFESDATPIHCRLTGRQSKTASLHLLRREENNVWVYEDPSAIMDSTRYSVEFSTLSGELATATAAGPRRRTK